MNILSQKMAFKKLTDLIDGTFSASRPLLGPARAFLRNSIHYERKT